MAVQRTILKVEGHPRSGSPMCEAAIAGDLLFTSICGPTHGTEHPMGVLTTPSSPVEKGFDEDAYWLFKRIRLDVEAAGGGIDSVLDLALYVNVEDTTGRYEGIMQHHFQETFPDPGQRPACRILNIHPEGAHWAMAATCVAALPNPHPGGDAQGRIVYSPTIVGRDPSTGQLPDDATRQAEIIFAETKTWVEGLGGTLDNVLNMMVYCRAENLRETLDGPWAAMWPNREDLPARQQLYQPQLLGDGVYFAALATGIV